MSHKLAGLGPWMIYGMIGSALISPILLCIMLGAYGCYCVIMMAFFFNFRKG